ncbi:MAG: class IV adenylate cyclase [Anaerolineaceae bacterium]|nr:class IV adenylate cyclase [Anaerolineaceae bacterium]
MKGYEVEAKFYLNDLAGLAARLQAAGARLIQEQVHEINLRFDTPDNALTAGRRVLRLRKDVRAYLTYKDPALLDQQVSVRREIEFEVGSFEAARSLLEALGYEVSVMYEKYRTTYTLGGAQVVLDEMPYGDFTEIEAADPELIRSLAAALGLDWEARCAESYLGLFYALKTRRAISARHLVFAEINKGDITPEDLGLRAADRV